jgi:putative RecB family exonuclease
MIAGAELLPVRESRSTNPANEDAKSLTGRDYVSWSAISTFRTCPLKYKFRYVDGLPEESVSSALVFGTGIHTAIEQHFQAALSGEEQPDVERLMFAYRSAWLPHDPEAISFGGSETRASLDALASKMLTAFLNSPAASVQGRVLGVEEEIRGTLVEGVPDLYGWVDLLTEDSDSLVVTDIKTSRGKWSPEQVEDSGEQLLLYSHLASEISPGKKIATRFLVLTKTREPVVEEHVREVNPAAVKRTLAGVERVWRAIEAGVFYPAPSTIGCASCGYREACRAWSALITRRTGRGTCEDCMPAACGWRSPLTSDGTTTDVSGRDLPKDGCRCSSSQRNVRRASWTVNIRWRPSSP